MAFLFALGFALLVLMAGHWDIEAVLFALLAGLGFGAWLSALVNRRIHAAAAARPSTDPDAQAIFAALEDIHWRLKRLEEAGGLGPSPLEAARDASAADAEAGLALDDHLVAVAPRPVASAMAQAADIALSPAPGPAPEPAVSTPASLPPRTAPPAATTAPHGSEGALDALLARARYWLLGGNTVVRVGIIVLFFGVAFLLKFAIDRAVLPLELRVAGVGLGAIALLAVGWRLRARREAYALALQGAGVGLLYLTLFGAFRLYHLVPPAVALAAMVAVAGLSALLALLQNAPALMATGVTGGFLAPLLASTGSGNHVALFSYYLVLNLGIFAVAWFKAWRPLNLLGFFFTVAIGLLWGTTTYTPAHFASTEPFLVLFFGLYLVIGVLFALRRGAGLGEWASDGRLPRRIVDATLVFGLPLVAFGFQAGLLAGRDSEFGLAFSALALAALYLGLARWLQARGEATLSLLLESFLALGVIFATLAIPLALDARWTSASWAVEGAALVWVGIHQQRRPARLFGLALQAAAALAWVVQPGSWDSATVPLANAFCLGATLIALSGLFSAWQLQARLQPASRLALGVFGWGLAWWLLAGLGEAHRLLGEAAFNAVAVLFLAASATVADALATRLAWPHARLPAQGLVLALGWMLFLTLGEERHAFAGGGWLAWPAALALHFRLQLQHDRQALAPAWSLRLHALGLWLLAALGAHELHWLAQHFDLAGGWRATALVVAPGVLLLAASSEAAATRWPLRDRAPAYLGWGAVPLLGAFALWVVVTDLSLAADPAPLPWLPLLNPVDLAHLFLGLVTWCWARRVRGLPEGTGLTADPVLWRAGLGALAFLWLNAVLLRSIHHWTGVPYRPDDLFASTLVQAALSLFWTTLALVLMATGARRAWRALWMTGAGLMAVVVVKLFMIDLDRVGSVARIVSFLGVGLLMLLIGYLAPVPPKASATDDAAPEA